MPTCRRLQSESASSAQAVSARAPAKSRPGGTTTQGAGVNARARKPGGGVVELKQQMLMTLARNTPNAQSGVARARVSVFQRTDPPQRTFWGPTLEGAGVNAGAGLGRGKTAVCGLLPKNSLRSPSFNRTPPKRSGCQANTFSCCPSAPW